MFGPVLSRRRFRISAAVIVAAGSLLWCSASMADETVQVCGSTYTNNVFASTSVPGISAAARCPTPAYNGSGFGLFNNSNTTIGQSGRWQADAPAGLELVGATASQISSTGLNDGGDYGGGFYWAGGGVATNNQTDQNPSLGMLFSSPSSYFGMQLVCGKATCSAPAQLEVGAFSLYVRETAGPSLAAPTGLWPASGWVRGSWPFFVWGNSPSGLCALSASLNGLAIGQTSSPRDFSSWHQCATPPISQAVDTTRYGQGAEPLTLSTVDAAGVPASLTRTIYIDNQQPSVSFSGPSDAPSTAGTQFVTASAAAGPSGVAGLSCSVDGAPARWYAASSVQVPVSGVGEHQVQCSSENNAGDGSGAHGVSPVTSFAIKIGLPTITSVAFSRIVDGLSCHRALERVQVKARWVNVRRHRKLVRVHRRARTKLVRVTHCHVRSVRRRVVMWVTVHHHGRKVRVRRHKTIRVLLTPRVVSKTRRIVEHGRASTVDGWLGTTSGVALGGQTVEVLTAPDNGRGNFRVSAVATTEVSGGWSARLPPGPSRLVTAVYAGGPTTEASLGAPVKLIVPATVQLLSASPRRLAWGATVRLTGRLRGGYLPPGGALVRLRIGQGSAVTTYGVLEHVTGRGRFSTSYTFGAGDPAAYRSFWFQVATLPMGDYPYAPATSRRLSVLVGGHPRPPPRPSGSRAIR